MATDFYNFIHPLHAFLSILIPFGFLNYITYKLAWELHYREFTWLLFASTLALNLFSFFMMQVADTVYPLQVLFLFSYYSTYIFLVMLLLKSVEKIVGLFMDVVLFLRDGIGSILFGIYSFLILKPLRAFNLNFIAKFFEYVFMGLKFMFKLLFAPSAQSTTSATQTTFRVKTFKNPNQYASIARGGEAHIYAVSRKSLVKIYKANYATSEKLETLKSLMGSNFSKNIVTPSAILNDEDENFIGYEMPKVKGVELGILFLPNGVMKNFPKYTLIDLVSLSLKILELFNIVHKESVIVGDINPRNILVESKDQVFLIDTDSFQINRPSGVGQAIYTHPKNIGKKYSSYMRTISDDTYALTMIVFQILHYGALPYGSSDVDELKRGVYLYSPNSVNNTNVHPDLASSHHRLSAELKNYFYTQFDQKKYLPLKILQQSLESYKKTLLKK